MYMEIAHRTSGEALNGELTDVSTRPGEAGLGTRKSIPSNCCFGSLFYHFGLLGPCVLFSLEKHMHVSALEPDYCNKSFHNPFSLHDERERHRRREASRSVLLL